MTPEKLDYVWYAGTPEGDRLTLLALGHRMTFREKVLWSEQCERLARRSAAQQKKSLKQAILAWEKPPSD